jgi:hypothetical protein
MSTIIAVDPGTEQSAVVEWDGFSPTFMDIMPNDKLREWVENCKGPSQIAVEMVASFGMPVGKEVFETVLQVGRLHEIAYGRYIPCRLVYRLQVKQHLCHDSRAKDSNIRQALIDRFGPPGVKAAKGVLYGVNSHLWAALAVAVFAHDTMEKPA